MRRKNEIKKSFTTAVKAVSLLMAAVMLITATPAAVALDTAALPGGLLEQVFTLMPEDGVTVTLSGFMPKNGSAEAKPADVAGDDVLHAYDISIFYPGGNEFEPDEENPISVSFQSNAIAEAIEEDNTTLEVEHIADSGKSESVALISAEDGEAVFDAECFSVYVIRTHTANDETLKPRKTFHFLSPDYTQIDDGSETYYKSALYKFPDKVNEMVSTQTVTDGESLQEIVLPENRDAGLFYGWYEVIFDGEADDGEYKYHWGTEEPKHIPFNEPIEVKEKTDTDVYLAPLFGHYRFLTFHQDVEGSDNANTIITRKLITLGEEKRCTMKISDVRAPSVNPNRIVFWGWKYTHHATDSWIKDGSKVEEIQTVAVDDSEIVQSITIEDTNEISTTNLDVKSMIFDIWPIFKEARWTYFESGGNGANYVPPQFIMLDNPPTEFNNAPERTGYNFLGWYYDIKNSDGTIAETVQITGENAQILNTATKQLATGVTLSGGKLVMTHDANELTFYAKWQPLNIATYRVIVWKQKISDDKNASDDAKTYDYEGYVDINGDTTQSALETQAFISGRYT